MFHSAKAIWDFEGIYCSSRHIPHVKFPGLIHPGILGCAPSAKVFRATSFLPFNIHSALQVLATWNQREGELIAANKLDRIVAQPPNPENVHAGAASEDIKAQVGREGARTIPGTHLLSSPKI
jgi:formamidase